MTHFMYITCMVGPSNTCVPFHRTSFHGGHSGTGLAPRANPLPDWPSCHSMQHARLNRIIFAEAAKSLSVRVRVESYTRLERNRVVIGYPICSRVPPIGYPRTAIGYSQSGPTNRVYPTEVPDSPWNEVHSNSHGQTMQCSQKKHCLRVIL